MSFRVGSRDRTAADLSATGHIAVQSWDHRGVASTASVVPGPLARIASSAAAVALGIVIGGAVGLGKEPWLLVVLGAAATAAGLGVVLWCPGAVIRGVGLVAGALPFGYVPGVHVPLFTLGAAACLAAVLIRPTASPRLSWLEPAIVGLMVCSLVSFVATARTVVDAEEFVKWSILTALSLVLLRLPRDELFTMGRWFVLGAAANVAFGVVVLALYPRPVLRALGVFGYRTDVVSVVRTTAGDARGLRLAGSWIEPNGAALCLVIALGVCMLVFGGRARKVLAAWLVVGVCLTLSRASLLTLVVATLALVLFHPTTIARRRAVVAALGSAMLGALLVPDLRHRLVMTVTGDDPASQARIDALQAFPGQMRGHWVFGLGWGRREFKDAEFSWLLNPVANAPLLSTYRGGLVAGLAFVLLVLSVVAVGYRLVRGTETGPAAMGALMLAAVVVALQLDHPVVAIPPITGTFALGLAFLGSAERQDRESRREGISPHPRGNPRRRGGEPGRASAALRSRGGGVPLAQPRGGSSASRSTG